jgi:hypothetical protein
MNLFRGRRFAHPLEQAVESSSTSLFSHLIDRQIRSGAIQPSFRIGASRSAVLGPLQEDVNSQFFRAPAISNHQGDRSGDAPVVRGEGRFYIQGVNGVNRRLSIRRIHNSYNVQVLTFVTVILAKDAAGCSFLFCFQRDDSGVILLVCG